MTQDAVKLSAVIGPAFYEVHKALKQQNFVYYFLKGGRGSLKSSFVSIEIILGMMQDEAANAVALRKVGVNLAESVYEQLKWAISMLGVDHLWKEKLSPLELEYLPTGQKIKFRGADKPKKIKSTKFSKGYCKYLWYEECDEFQGMEEIRVINQSLMRGGDAFTVFYTYNPPKSARNWVNEEVLTERPGRMVHHSTYLQAPPEWLGAQFIADAEDLKKNKPEAYRHEYLGEVTGTGAEVFSNLTLRTISDEEIQSFDRIARGLDWGFAADPLHYTENHYDKKHKRLYIFYEIQQIRLPNWKAAELVKARNKSNKLIICDSAEPKSIAEFASYGINVTGARKGPDSVDYGIKWLQDLNEIIIDPDRCPNTAREFSHYELERDKEGNLLGSYPDKDNHSIDATRYSRELDIRNVKIR